MLGRAVICKSDTGSILHLTPFRDGRRPVSCCCSRLLNCKLSHFCRSIATFSRFTRSACLSEKQVGQGSKCPFSALGFWPRRAVPESFRQEKKEKDEAEANDHSNNPDICKRDSLEELREDAYQNTHRQSRLCMIAALTSGTRFLPPNKSKV